MTQRFVLLFDLDGTLIDSVPDLADALNEALRAHRLPTYPEETIRYWVGNGAQMLVKRGIAGKREVEDVQVATELFEAVFATFMQCYQSRLSQRTRLYEGVAKTLRALSDCGKRMAIVTNKPERFVPPLLKALGIESFFDLIVGGDTTAHKKPHSAPLEYALKHLGVRAQDAVMIGDSRNDIISAHALGIPVVAVTYGYNYGEPIKSYQPEYTIERFETLKEVIGCTQAV